MRSVLILALLAGGISAEAATPTTCGIDEPYAKALCAYQRRSFAEAEAGFRAIVQEAAADSRTLRSMYFLARTDMKRGNFDEAAKLFIRIYTLDKAFYDSWGCDYLLGECRRASGKE